MDYRARRPSGRVSGVVPSDFLTPSDAAMPPDAAKPPAVGIRGEARWWLIVAVAGVAAGGVGIAITELLHLVQHISFGYTENTFLRGVEQASSARRVVVLLVGGLVAGFGWWLLRSRTTVHTVGEAISDRPRRLPLTSTTLDGCLQVIVVGMGASLGREGAPRQIAAAASGWLAERAKLTGEQRRIIVAAGAGAGLAAVYNVPFAGTLFTLEVLLVTINTRVVVATALCCGIATVVSWLVLPNEPTYHVAAFRLVAPVVVFAVLAGPLMGVAAWGFGRLMTLARRRVPSGWRLPVATVAVFTALGALAIPYPQLLGNGKGPTELALTGTVSGATALVLALLKPAVTAACLRSGALGGLLTPSLATGALLGAAAGHVWTDIWGGGQLGAYALIAATAMITITQRAPLCAIAFALELTHSGAALLVPLALAAGTAYLAEQLLARRRPSAVRAPARFPSDSVT